MRSKRVAIFVIPSLLAVGIFLLNLVLTGSSLDNHTEDPSERSIHDAQIQKLSADVEEAFTVNFAVQSTRSESSIAQIYVDVLVDDDFIVENGAEWRDNVTELIRGTNALLDQVGVEIKLGSVGAWVSDGDEASLLGLIDSAVSQSQTDSSRMLIVITCEDPPKKDGLAQSKLGRIIVEYYHHDVPRNSALLSHEIGHLLGASHHEDSIECVTEGCIMDKKGYQHSDYWCDHHKQQIGDNVRNVMTDSVLTDTASNIGRTRVN